MGHTAILDAARARMIVFGGIDMTGRKNDVWILALAPSLAWSAAFPVGAPPSPRWDHTAVYDPIGDRLIVFGGDDASGAQDDVWALSLGDTMAWVELTPAGAGPGARASHTMVFDPAQNRIVTHGGFNGFGFRSDVWALSLAGGGAWEELIAAGATPVARRDAIAVFDAPRGRMIVHGGHSGDASFLDDAWALDLSGPTAWTPIEPSNAAPVGSITHAGALDAARDRLVLFGGSYHNETWALSLSEPIEWEELLPEGDLPPGRIDHTLVYSPGLDAMIAFGGHTGLATLDDTWTLGLSDATGVPGPARVDRGLVVWPNPAVSDVTFRFSEATAAAAQTAPVRLTIYDLQGRAVRQLDASAGGAPLRWDLRGKRGERVASGRYLCVIRAGDLLLARRLIVTR
jgi:hypothetical protein